MSDPEESDLPPSYAFPGLGFSPGQGPASGPGAPGAGDPGGAPAGSDPAGSHAPGGNAAGGAPVLPPGTPTATPSLGSTAPRHVTPPGASPNPYLPDPYRPGAATPQAGGYGTNPYGAAPAAPPGAPAPNPYAPTAYPSGPSSYGTAPGVTPLAYPMRPGPPLGRPSRRRSGGGVIAAVAVGVIAVPTVLVLANLGSDEPRPGPGPTSVALPDDSEQVWSVDSEVDGLVPLSGASLDGSGYGTSYEATVFGDLVVQRLGDSSYDAPAQLLVGRQVEEGDVRWSVELPGALCSPVPVDGADPTELVCAWSDGGPQGLRRVSLADGTTAGDVDVPEPVARVLATPTGIGTIDVADPDTGATAVRWYDVDGEPVWSEPITSGDVWETLVWDGSDGYELTPSAALVPLGDAAIIAGGAAPVLLSPDGIEEVTLDDCWLSAVFDDGYLCEGYPDTTFVRDGSVVWTAPDLTVVSSYNGRAEVALVSREYSLGGGADVYRGVDPATGVVGEVLLESEEYARLLGTPELPLLVVEEERDDYDEPTVATIVAIDPATGGALWTADVDSRQYADVLVIGDRVIVRTDLESWTVLDAADGSVVGGATIPYGTVVEAGGDAVSSGYSDLTRVDLP